MIFTTSRLIIRNYRDTDRAILFGISANPLTRAYHTRVPDRVENDAFIDAQIATLNSVGCGYAVVERKEDGAVLGDVGMRPMGGDMPFPDPVCYDIGWMLDPQYFGQGYATEAALGWLGHDFRDPQPGEVVSFAAAANLPSIGVMERIGMKRDAALDFDHPGVAAGHPLRPQMVYTV